MPGTAQDFYQQQFQGNEYAAGVANRDETADLEAFISRFGLADKRVLELGCGRGAFQHLVRDWVGVDLAASAASHVSKPFVVGSAEQLPFCDEVFDGIWSIAVLEHVPRPERALTEILRVLRPGGVAFLAPAWHCRSWAAEGYAVRPWGDFGLYGKLIKASIPVREALWFRALQTLPARVWREAVNTLRGGNTQFRYRALQANYETFWCADSDACCSMDPHEMLLWFRSRGWTIPSHPGRREQLLSRHGAIIVQKP